MHAVPAAWESIGPASEDAGLPSLRVGFMPLTDSAPLLMAALLGFDRKHGVRLVLRREASWASIRDKLLRGELHLAQMLYSMVYGVHLGLTGRQADMNVLMTLNRNGQGISLSRSLVAQGAHDLDSLRALMQRQPRRYTFAQTFPGGTHALWLNYWLASAGIHPLNDVYSIVVPPPLMVSNVRAGNMDGFSVGEPWNQRGIDTGVSVHACASQDIWPDHPEKVLACGAGFAAEQPDLVCAAMAAVLEACRWLDASDANRFQAAEALVRAGALQATVGSIAPRLCGRYADGLGREWRDPHRVAFFDDGDVNYPWLSDGMWFLTQFKRWGLLPDHPDYQLLSRAIQRIDLYRAAADALGVNAPKAELRRSVLMDGVAWDGEQPAAYADAFPVQVRPSKLRAA